MVDLMMWLVIAALLMAAAIQGIGYYQKAAYLYQVKNDVMGGATKVLSVSGISHTGKVDEAIVGEGLVITQKTQDVVLEADTDPNGNPMIRGTHPGIPGKEVIYLFRPYGIYKDGQVYVIDKDAPLGSNEGNSPQEPVYPPSTADPNGDIDGDGVLNSSDPDIDGDGTPNVTDTTPDEAYYPPSAAIPNGDIDGDGTPNSSDTDIDGDGTPNETDATPDGDGSPEDLSDEGYGDGTTAVTVGTITGDGSGSFMDNTNWGHSHEPPMNHYLGSGVLDMDGWQYNQASRSVSVKFSTNGSFTGVGGSWNVLAHADIACYDEPSKKYYYASKTFVGILKGPYTSNPGPNSTWQTIDCGNSAPGTALPAQVVVRTATDAEWAGYSLGYRNYAYTLPGMVESWARTITAPAG